MGSTRLGSLHRADGSSTYSRNGYTAVAAVNGPIEVQRRDELAGEAVVDVAIRPASGVGGLPEKILESNIRDTLRQVILISAHPRTLIQINLQIITVPRDDYAPGVVTSQSYIPSVLPALLQASMLALLSTSLPLMMTIATAVIVIDSEDGLISDPSPEDLEAASSIHIFSFSNHGDLLITESDGNFDQDTWRAAHDMALQMCTGSKGEGSNVDDVDMESIERVSLRDVLKDTVQAKVAADLKWKEDLG